MQSGIYVGIGKPFVHSVMIVVVKVLVFDQEFAVRFQFFVALLEHKILWSHQVLLEPNLTQSVIVLELGTARYTDVNQCTRDHGNEGIIQPLLTYSKPIRCFHVILAVSRVQFSSLEVCF